MSPEDGGSLPLGARPAMASAKRLAWRAAVIGLALHAAAVVSGAPTAPSAARALAFMGCASAAALLWSRAQPVVLPSTAGWDRAGLEAVGVGPVAAVFALLLGWSAAIGLPA